MNRSSCRVVMGISDARLPVAESGVHAGRAPLPRLKVPGAGIPVNRDLGTPCGATVCHRRLLKGKQGL